MTTLLKNAFEKATQLPDAAQELLARQLLDDIEAELKWNDTLSKSQKKLDEMANKALKEYHSGNVHHKGFDEL